MNAYSGMNAPSVYDIEVFVRKWDQLAVKYFETGNDQVQHEPSRWEHKCIKAVSVKTNTFFFLRNEKDKEGVWWCMCLSTYLQFGGTNLDRQRQNCVRETVFF